MAVSIHHAFIFSLFALNYYLWINACLHVAERKCSFLSSFFKSRVKLLSGIFAYLSLPGNKCDLWEKRHVLFEDACTLAEKYGLLAVLETSAKESKNIDEVFVLMARELIARNSLHLYGENTLNTLPLDSSPILITQGPSEKTHCTCWVCSRGQLHPPEVISKTKGSWIS